MIKFENYSNGRYFYIKIQKDLLNDTILTIFRGGRNHHIVRHYGYNCPRIIANAIRRLSRLRLRRGYTLVQ